jgi:hypothetical protein
MTTTIDRPHCPIECARQGDFLPRWQASLFHT